MRNIFVPLDFSQHSRAALELAVNLSRRNNSTLAIFHVVENPKTSILLPDLYLENIPDNKNFNDALVRMSKEKIASWLPSGEEKVEYTSHAVVGNLFDEFKRYVKDHEPELIVMGVKGHNDKSVSAIGSFTERVTRKSECPVLVVKAGFSADRFQKIMMIADFLENEATVAFEIKRLNKLLNAHVEILRINTPQDFESDHYMETKFQNFREKYKLENCSLFTYNHTLKEEGIILAAKKSKADLIAVASQSRSIMERLVPFSHDNSFEDDFIDHLEYPLWIFKPQFKLPAEPGFVEEIRGFKFF